MSDFVKIKIMVFKESQDKIEAYAWGKHPIATVLLIVIVSIGFFVWGCSKVFSSFVGRSPWRVLHTHISGNKDNKDSKGVYKGVDDKIIENKDDEELAKEQIVNVFQNNSSVVWVGLDDRFLREEESMFKPKLTKNFPEGREIFSKRNFGTTFTLDFKFRPLDFEEINVTINYGHLWRVVIGNGDYNQVILQYNNIFPEKNIGTGDWKTIKEEESKKWISRNSRLEAQKEITVEIRSRPITEESVIEVSVIIIGYVHGERKKKEFKFNYNVDAKQNCNALIQPIGIGLLDPKNSGVRTVLKSFKIK